MVKIFGFRITPLFLLILGLECIAILLSLYIGVLLYSDKTSAVLSVESVNHTVSLGMFLFMMLAILTIGFFSQVKIINNMKRTANDMILGLGVALLTMVATIFSHIQQLDLTVVFIALLLSVSTGLIVVKLSALSKYWRFLVRTGVN